MIITKALAFALLLTFGISCSSNSDPQKLKASQDKMEEYVLIEFAAKLEEDYHRLHPMQHYTGSANASPSP